MASASFNLRVPTPEEFGSIFNKDHFDKSQNGDAPQRVLLAGRSIKDIYQDSSMAELLELDLEQLKAKDEVIWIDIDSPTQANLEQLETKFGFHPITTEDLIEDSREKVETFENYIFVVTKEMHYARYSNHLVIVNINIIIFPNWVITVHPSYVECVEQVVYRLKYGKGFSTEKGLQTSDWVLYAIDDCIVDMFETYVKGMIMEGEALDALVLLFNSGEQNDLLRRIGMARRLLTTLRSHLWTKKEVLTIITAKDLAFISRGIKLYLRDVLDNIQKMEEKLNVSKETLNNLHATYLARISIEMAEASSKVNSIMKKFSAVATVFIPLTFITSLFGMNVTVPGQQGSLWWFGGITITCVVFILIFLKYFHLKQWL